MAPGVRDCIEGGGEWSLVVKLSGIGLGVTRSEEVCVLSWEILSGDWEVVFGVKGLRICLELPGL